MNEKTESLSYPKFTKGEKCIFAHLVITFSLLLVTAIVYIIHLYHVDHDIHEVFITQRSVAVEIENSEHKTIPIGQLFLNTTPVTHVCNTILLAPQWSVGPGYCIAIRSEPDLSHLLYTWRIKYLHNSDKRRGATSASQLQVSIQIVITDHTDVTIKRSIVHPHFNRDTFDNNIGLVQHDNIGGLEIYKFSNQNILKRNDSNDLVIVSWNHDVVGKKDVYIAINPIEILNEETCSNYIASIIEIRSYEFCAVLKKNVNTILDHGSLIVNQKIEHVLGFFTWGEKRGREFPLVILNLTTFQDWLDIIITS